MYTPRCPSPVGSVPQATRFLAPRNERYDSRERAIEGGGSVNERDDEIDLRVGRIEGVTVDMEVTVSVLPTYLLVQGGFHEPDWEH